MKIQIYNYESLSWLHTITFLLSSFIFSFIYIFGGSRPKNKCYKHKFYLFSIYIKIDDR
jgi:hypothetical protein